MSPTRVFRPIAVLLLMSSGAIAANTGTITGQVLYKDGSVAKGVPIKVLNPSTAQKKTPADDQSDAKDIVCKTTTDDNGQYTCKDVAAGVYRVEAGSLMTGMSAKPATVQAGGTLTLNLTIKPPHKPV